MNKKHILWGALLTALIGACMLWVYHQNYDIEYLLFLQNFRNGINNAWTPFLEWLSHFAVTELYYIPVFLYWCLSKENGLFTFASVYTCLPVNAALKLTACIYRPWIRDVRVYPAGNAIVEATGYSFPSGHTMTAAPIYGAIGLSYKDKSRIVSFICLALILLTGFSRNYLGVHTPQDVLIGLIVSAWVLYFMSWLFPYLKEHPEQENKFLIAGVLLSVVIMIYIHVKSYPLDYVDGKLLVDPNKMMVDAYKDITSLGVFCIARFIEKKFVQFKSPGFNKLGISLSAAGLIIAYLFNTQIQPIFIEMMGTAVGKMANGAIFIFFVITIWPFVIKKISEHFNKKVEGSAA